MSDYISKEKLMSHIESNYKSFGEDYDALQILGDIEDFPTEQRPHGEWIEHKWAEEFDGHLISNYECSCCHSWKRENTDFCPNCGADMRKEGDEN